LTLLQQDHYAGVRPGNVARVEYVQLPLSEALVPYDNDELDLATVRYTPRLADLVDRASEVTLGPATWSCYLAFDHSHPMTSNLDLRRALAHAIDRSALEQTAPANLIVATGGVVPPALQGHTPGIVPSFDPDLARDYLRRAGSSDELAIAALEEWRPLLTPVLESWREVLGLSVELRTWDLQQAMTLRQPWQFAPIAVAGWLPGYPDPEYYLRLLLHSDSKTNEGGFAFLPFDTLIERARQERDGRARLELFHEADRMAVSDRIALIPLAYGRSMAFVKPWVKGWWEFGKSSTSFADLLIDAQPELTSGA
jgi:oligopeptide transport system substrate-binding protein